MIRKKHCVITVLLFLLSFSAWAQNVALQDTVSQESFSIQEAVDYAIEHNKTLQNASLAVKQQEAARWQTIATMLPQVSGKLNYTNMLGYEMNLLGMERQMNPYGDLAITAAMSISGAQIVGSLISNLAIEMSDISKRQTAQNITSQVRNVYFTIVAMEQTVALLKQNLGHLENLSSMTEQSVAVGVSEQTDADKLSVQVSSMKNTINNSDRSITVLYNSLKLLLGVNVDATITLTQKIDELINVETVIDLLSNEFILDNNYSYQLAKKNAELAQKQITLSAMDYVPSLTGAYQYSGRTYFGAEEGLNMTAPNTIQISLNVPIFSSGVRAAAITEKKLAYKAAENSLSLAEDQLRTQYSQARYNLTTAYENYEIQKKNIEVSQRVLDNVSKKFQNGYGSSLDVTNSSTELIAAQSNYVNALVDMVTAYNTLTELLNK